MVALAVAMVILVAEWRKPSPPTSEDFKKAFVDKED